ncbi:heterokaryon incompatibility protein-domain-containing protein [Fusarium solani]|uniref:Heterokaryon incompatibility protein-domain-containing protein n=1 Tax=Fusarium solani TaxID=169388 RepID=A0A9P9FZF8_FUSSL|nr:heterokaryon incompatibility protein-domain-containing protein [Fusarium solani]KAH7228388.1 heterokaryon incompatibility protein-domain-containing protein [Fusarium solani]
MAPEMCIVCKGLSERTIIDYNSLYHKALDGCPGCSLLLTAILRVLDREPRAKSLDIQPGEGAWIEPLVVRVSRADGSEHGIEIYRQAEGQALAPSNDCPGPRWPFVGFARPVSPNSASALMLARRWVEDCTETHTECPKESQTVLPTRVLLLGSLPTNVRLVLSQGKPAKYVALSHCWGSSMPLKLTTSSLASLMEGISMESLPKTFQDAVHITRFLGIDYLWIDSLCILQDCPEDWAAESSQMARIYTTAWVTIAADQTSECTGGIFGERRTEDLTSTPIRLSSCPCNHCTVYVRRWRSIAYPSANHSVNSQTPTSGLNTRGWVLQERLMSPRTLHFTGSEVAWECPRQVSCECRLGNQDPGQHLIFKRAFVYPIEGDIRVHGPLASEAGNELSLLPQLHWHLVVYEFTARVLSVSTDRLPALSGLASILCQRTSQEYYFGLLSAQPARSLLWRITTGSHRSGPSRRLPQAYAPSWSFGSVTGRVEFGPKPEYARTFRPRVRIHGVTKVLASTNPYGPGTGVVSLEGLLVPVRIEDSRYPGTRSEVDRLFVVNTAFESNNAPYDYPENCPWSYFQPDVDDCEEIAAGHPTFFLVVGDYSARPITFLLGLILSGEVGTDGTMRYRRVGFVTDGGNSRIRKWSEYGSTKRIQLI